ncbi:hypothetical protein [Pontibacter actiniarum]|uniref:Uncharacterized protein n=1 Tax=Pontibacter actiniarum TaxID=323450 RepID=A0A1X9YN91_9BACT|nr:hypothetical protein [Pontibacter actiniarum]ARS34291.1 hypothetical protein CA264_01890 [Pontibacter actiniarum]
MDEQSTRNKQTTLQLYNTVLPAMAEHIHRNITPVLPLFHDFKLERLIDTWTKDPAADPDESVSVENGNVQQLGLKLRLEGFQRAGAEAFDISKDLLFKLEHHSYTVGPNKNDSWLEKEYHQKWEKSEYETIAEKWSEELIEELTQRLEKLS